MALKTNRDSEIDTTKLDIIRFSMCDDDAKVRVSVSTAALHALASREHVHLSDPLFLFNKYRIEVEQAATRKYARLKKAGTDILIGEEDFQR